MDTSPQHRSPTPQAGPYGIDLAGLTWNQNFETGGAMVGKTARVDIDIEPIKHAESA